MRLIIPILLNCLLVFIFYLADKYTLVKKLSYAAKQIIVGLVFGALSAFASGYGVELLGTTVNVRDAAPLTAGLVFGAPAGVISGLIGGLYRWFSVAWGAGTYTQLACTIATILAGIMAAGLRILMFDDKKPTWGYGISITVVCEVIHMLLIFLTNMDDASYAFEFVKGATIPMIIGNTAAVGASIVIVSALSRERLIRNRHTEQIAQTFQRWLLACIVVAFLATSIFTFFLQNTMARLETKEMFTATINDVQKDIRGKSDEHLLEIVEQIANEYDTNINVSIDDLAKKYNVIEINIVNEDGRITESTQKDLVGAFNMYDTEQSREFMVLAGDTQTYVQEYGPVGSDGTTMRKFAGMKIKRGGYMQVGYSTEQFHEKLDEFVVDVTENRHVGASGFVVVCDEKLNLVTQDEHNGKHISSFGIEPNEEMLQGVSASELYDVEIVGREEYNYVFTFVEGYCIIAAMPEADTMFMRDASIYNSVFMQVLIFGLLFVFIYILIKKVIINNLRKINSTLAQITEGNLDVTVDVRSNEEFASLSDDINSTVATLKRYIAEAAARIDKELEYAKQIQLAALPVNYPSNEEYSIYAKMIAAKEVGGDFYDFYELDDNKVAFLVADVSGKGIPAAMFMMTAKTIIKDLAESGLEVNEIFTKANDKLCENNESGMFVTAWMGILDTTTGILQYANAGHNPPLMKHANGEYSYLRSRAGLVLAGMEDMQYRANEMKLETGDRIFLYTDGVTEATNVDEKLYGEDRLFAYMNAHQGTKAVELLAGLKADIDEFVGEAPQFDDITMLMFDFTKKEREVNMTNKIFPAKTEALGDVIGFLEETLEGYDCPMKVTFAVSVAIEEIFVNIAQYAYEGKDGDVEFEIGFNDEDREITFRMSDNGVPFNPLKREDPDITLPMEEREIGGLGIFITKKTMDSVVYAYENEKNVLTMIKKI